MSSRHSHIHVHQSLAHTTAWMQDDYKDVIGRVESGTETEVERRRMPKPRTAVYEQYMRKAGPGEAALGLRARTTAWTQEVEQRREQLSS